MTFLHIEEYIEYCELNNIVPSQWLIKWTQDLLKNTEVIKCEVR